MNEMTTAEKTAAFLATIPAALDLQNGRDEKGSRLHGPEDVVLAIRRDLKLAVKAKLIPTGAKFSVTRRDYKSINVELTAWQGEVLCAGYFAACLDAFGNGQKDGPSAEASREFMSSRGHRCQGQDGRLTAEINAVMSLVESLVERHNYNNSDLQTDYFDVGYYTHITARAVAAMAERGVALECNPAARELAQRTIDAAKRLGPAVVRSICGKLGASGCGDWAKEQLLKLDAMANGRPLVYNKSRGSWVVDAI